jgi:hypothetical protein
VERGGKVCSPGRTAEHDPRILVQLAHLVRLTESKVTAGADARPLSLAAVGTPRGTAAAWIALGPAALGGRTVDAGVAVAASLTGSAFRRGNAAALRRSTDEAGLTGPRTAGARIAARTGSRAALVGNARVTWGTRLAESTALGNRVSRQTLVAVAASLASAGGDAAAPAVDAVEVVGAAEATGPVEATLVIRRSNASVAVAATETALASQAAAGPCCAVLPGRARKAGLTTDAALGVGGRRDAPTRTGAAAEAATSLDADADVAQTVQPRRAASLLATDRRSSIGGLAVASALVLAQIVRYSGVPVALDGNARVTATRQGIASPRGAACVHDSLITER